ncbi:GGDEF domain-containing protein [Kribbella aluminosa]|uniref:GGDEF domain-containing protein n=1 Tax=Kribbella aluminosa TaxID=416017 RepID=A0ABS4UST8_9ACTN|nr:GGDEF domain-containing protein [Kribbella aluminosa]MBP2354609.1 GGDEF domain-containing protein [Kribbella aluminosa]
MSPPTRLPGRQIQLTPAADTRHDRFPPPTSGGWCEDARDDPITGLVAWPGFFTRLPGLIADAIGHGNSVGLAIGDVDNLKGYVEGTKAVDAQSFGHLAGNAFMGRLGTLARNWLWRTSLEHSCLATFGGDEIVLLATTTDGHPFLSHVEGLRNHLCAGLPRTVSFGAGVISPTDLPTTVVGDHWWREFTVHTIGAIEHALFDHKHARNEGAPIAQGFIAHAPLGPSR